MVNQTQLSAGSERARDTGGVFEEFGHLKPGVTFRSGYGRCGRRGCLPCENLSEGSCCQTHVLATEGLTSFGPPVRAFVTDWMALACLILLAACANLGSLFAARAADALERSLYRLALGSSRKRILRQLFTEAILVSTAGGALGVSGSFVLLRRLSTWQPLPAVPIHMPVNSDAKLFVFALVLALASGFLFALVPVRQVLRANRMRLSKPDRAPGSANGLRLAMSSSSFKSPSAPSWSHPLWWPCAVSFSRFTATWI